MSFSICGDEDMNRTKFFVYSMSDAPMKLIVIILSCLFLSNQVFAGGYRVALQGQKALGMGHTGVAVTESSEVVFFNPAGMSFLSSSTDMTAGMTFIDGITKFQNTTSHVSAETDNPIGTPFYLYYAKRHDQTTSYGLGVYTPYGNTVEWKKDWPGSHLVNNIKLKTFYIQPTVSFKINESLSFGFGPTYVVGNIEFNRNLSTSLVDENNQRANVTIEATGISSLGFNLGGMIKPIKKITFGVNYRSKVELKAAGEEADFENIPTSMQTGYADTTFDATLVLPAELTIGLTYQLSKATLFAFDVNRTFWSAYKNLNVEFKNAAGMSLNPRNYSDVNIYRVGVQHAVGAGLILRGGAYYDESPISEGYFTPETARNDGLGLTAGLSYQLTPRLTIDASFLYLMFEEFNGDFRYIDEDSNSGTPYIAFGGEYKSSVISGGLGLQYNY